MAAPAPKGSRQPAIQLDAYEVGAAMRTELEKLREKLTPEQAYQWVSEALDKRILELNRDDIVPHIQVTIESPCHW